MTIDNSTEESIDLFDPEQLANLSDREVMECMLAYLRDIHVKIDTAEKIISQFASALEGLQDNPMLRMLGVQFG